MGRRHQAASGGAAAAAGQRHRGRRLAGRHPPAVQVRCRPCAGPCACGCWNADSCGTAAAAAAAAAIVVGVLRCAGRPCNGPCFASCPALHRVAKPMIETLLLRLKQAADLSGRITAEFLDETDCVGERCAALRCAALRCAVLCCGKQCCTVACCAVLSCCADARSLTGSWADGSGLESSVVSCMPEADPPRPACHAGPLLSAGTWQSERLAAVLFATADTLPDLRRIDDALRWGGGGGGGVGGAVAGGGGVASGEGHPLAALLPAHPVLTCCPRRCSDKRFDGGTSLTGLTATRTHIGRQS